MGRARRQAQVVVAGRDFDTVFGTRRGSVAAQAQRDINEHSQLDKLDSVLEAFAVEVEVASGWRAQTDLLGAAYRVRAHQPGAPGYAELMELLFPRGLNTTLTVSELAVLVSFGDPAGAPGFTDSAVSTLAAYFAAPSARVGRFEVREMAEHVINVCLQNSREDVSYEQHYERLRPLCEGLGVWLGGPADQAGPELGLFAAEMLGRATSHSSIAGPLATWVAAFVNRLDGGAVGASERAALVNVVIQFPLAERATGVIAPLAQRLQRELAP